MDAFDMFWRWANKPLEDHTITIPAELHHAVTSLREEDRHDREKVNCAAAHLGARACAQPKNRRNVAVRDTNPRPPIGRASRLQSHERPRPHRLGRVS